MDRYELNIKIEQMNKLVRKGDYNTASRIAEQLDWKKIKQWPVMSNAIDAFVATKKYDKARNVCVYAYNKRMGGKRLLATLMDMYLKLGEYEDAEEIYNEYVEVAPRDIARHTLLYELKKAKGAPIGELIDILQEYKENELDEAYEYELALLYAKAGLADRCVRECDDLVLWFSDGEYVEKALKLKQKYAELTDRQTELLRQFGAGNTKKPSYAAAAKEEYDAVPKDSYAAGDMTAYEGTGYENAGYEPTGYENAGYETADYENAGYGTAGYENAGYEPAGYGTAGYENAGYDAAEYEAAASRDAGEDYGEYAVYGETSAGQTGNEYAGYDGQYYEDGQEYGNGADYPDMSAKPQEAADGDVKPTYIDELGNTTEWTPIDSEENPDGNGAKTEDVDKTPYVSGIYGRRNTASDGGRSVERNISSDSGRSVEKSMPPIELEDDYEITIKVPDYTVYDTRNVQEELKGHVQEILEASRRMEQKEEADEEMPLPDPTKEIVINRRQWRKASRNKPTQVPTSDTTVIPKLDGGNYERVQKALSGDKLSIENLTEEEMAAIVAQLQAKKAEEQNAQIEGQMDLTQWLAQMETASARDEAQEGEKAKAAAQKEAEAKAAARKEAEARAAAQKEAEAKAKAQKEAEARAAAQKEAEAKAKAQKEAEAKAKAQKEAEAKAKAQKEAEARIAAQKEAEARAAAQKEAEAKAAAQKEAEARIAAQKEAEAKAAAQKEAEARIAVQKEAEAQKEAEEEEIWSEQTYTDVDSPSEELEEVSQDETEEAESTDNADIERIIDDTVKRVMEENKSGGEGKGYALQPEERRFLEKYLYMTGMEKRLVKYIASKRDASSDKTSSTGNVVIMGNRSTDKTAFAVNLFKALHAYDENREQKLARISAERINGSGFKTYEEKLRGQTLIIENGGRINREQISQMMKFMNSDTDGTLFILEDEEFDINKLFAENPDFAEMFSGRFMLKQYTVNELVDIAKDYADSQGWRVEDKALFQLYLILGQLPNDDQGNIVTTVKEIMDYAGENAKRRLSNKLFGRFRSILVIKDTDFITNKRKGNKNTEVGDEYYNDSDEDDDSYDDEDAYDEDEDGDEEYEYDEEDDDEDEDEEDDEEYGDEEEEDDDKDDK